MKPRWLLLAVSVICLLVLFPAVVLSQGSRRVNAGCGTATIDGYAWPAEWANAGRVDLFGLPTNHGVEVSAPIDLPEVDVSQPYEAGGELLVMNDMNRFYMATRLTLDHARLHPDWWMAWMYIMFTDEGNALDGMWDAPDCGPPPPGEGWVFNYDDTFASGRYARFYPESQAEQCNDEPLVGVRWKAAPDTSLVFEQSFDFNSSDLDKVGPGDCFGLGLWVWAYGCELGAGCPESPSWPLGEALWPADFDWTPSTFGRVCLDPCEVDFVPEPGSILHLGSGLAGLAGYATLRWRSRE